MAIRRASVPQQQQQQLVTHSSGYDKLWMIQSGAQNIEFGQFTPVRLSTVNVAAG